MIKVVNNTASREPLPSFLQGLAWASLADLSWTDPALGVRGLAWWPEENQTQPLGVNEKYGSEVLTVDSGRKVVVTHFTIVPMTQEEINAKTAEQEAAKAEQKAQITAQLAELTARLKALGQSVESVETKLAVHEAICAERYNRIEGQLTSGDKRMTKIEYLLYIVILVQLLGPGAAAEFFKHVFKF